MSNRAKAYILMLINTVIWGASLQVVKNSYDYVSAFRFLFYRYIIASLLATPIIVYYLRKYGKKLKKKIPTIVILEILGVTINLTLLYIGLTKTTSIEASLIITTGPIFSIIGGVIYLKEKEERNEVMGLVISFMGTILLVLTPLIQEIDGDMKISFIGSVLVLAYNIVNASYFILAKKHYKNTPSFFAAGISFIVGLVSFGLIAIFIDSGSIPIFIDNVSNDVKHWEVLFAASYMGVLGSFIALTFYLKALTLIEASEASLFYYLEPVIYIPLGVLWLQEKVTTLQIAALVLIITGVYVASIRAKKRRSRRKRKR